MWEIIAQTVGTAGATALLTVYATSKVNQNLINVILNKINEIETEIKDIDERVYNHENRISKIEGVIKTEEVVRL